MKGIIIVEDKPKHCSECPMHCSAHYNGDMSQCKIKSVDGLIDQIEREAYGDWNKDVTFGLGLAIEIIKKYCEV